MHRPICFLCLVLTGLGLAHEAIAQDAPLPPKQTTEQAIAKKIRNAEGKNYISLSFENDLIGGNATDQFYTSGVRATYFNVNTEVPFGLHRLADQIPTFDINDTTSTFFSVGQNMYTPEDITISAAQPND